MGTRDATHPNRRTEMNDIEAIRQIKAERNLALVRELTEAGCTLRKNGWYQDGVFLGTNARDAWAALKG